MIEEEPAGKIEGTSGETNGRKILVKNEIYEDAADTGSEIEMVPLEENGSVKCEGPESSTEISIDRNDAKKGIYLFFSNLF